MTARGISGPRARGEANPHRFKRIAKLIEANRFNTHMMRSFDWSFFLLVMAIALFGVVCIFCATATPMDTQPQGFMQMLQTQPTSYARLQIMWIMVGLMLMAAMVYLDYERLGQWSNLIYWANIALLFVVLFMEKGRGNMAGWFHWGSDSNRTMQPSEFGKLAIIIALAKLFAGRQKPITTVAELVPVLVYIGLPLVLIVLQPDVGTALVYIVIFAVMLFASGTNYKLIIGMVCILVLLAVPVWYFMNTSESSFRANRIRVWLDPTLDTSGAGMQMANARIALGSGGLRGKGMFSVGSFASLNYIPDDHTDFIFAIVCETFGFIGAAVMVGAMVLMLMRMVVMSMRAADAFGSYVILGVMSMMAFHIIENIGMVLNLLPVTGIPLPFISYGGSNLLTNMMGLGIVLSISMRSKERTRIARPRMTARL
jgi:rod shape determining protein RodA